MRPAESGEEVVERFFVGQVYHGQAQAPLVTISVEQIVLAERNVEQVARRDTRRIFIGVFRAACGDHYPQGSRCCGSAAAA